MTLKVTLLALAIPIVGSAVYPQAWCFWVLLGALVFVTGNRIARQWVEDGQHEELMDMLRGRE